MTRKTLLNRTIDKLSKLPDHKLQEVSDFTDFLLDRIEGQLINEGIQKMTSDSKAFKFLDEEDEIYTVEDLKEKYQ